MTVVFLRLNIYIYKLHIFTYTKNKFYSPLVIIKKLPNLLIKKSNVEEFIIVVDLANMCQGNEDFPPLKENEIGKVMSYYH